MARYHFQLDAEERRFGFLHYLIYNAHYKQRPLSDFYKPLIQQPKQVVTHNASAAFLSTMKGFAERWNQKFENQQETITNGPDSH